MQRNQALFSDISIDEDCSAMIWPPICACECYTARHRIISRMFRARQDSDWLPLHIIGSEVYQALASDPRLKIGLVHIVRVITDLTPRGFSS